MPGLALDLERTASGARAGRVHRSLQRLAASSRLGLAPAEWSDVSGAVDGDGADNAEASRPSWRTLARVPARGVTESNKRTLQRTPSRCGGNSRGKVRNVRGHSSASYQPGLYG